MSATKKLSAGVYQVIGTDWSIRNDCHRSWLVAKVVDGSYSLDPGENYWIFGLRSDAIQEAKRLHARFSKSVEVK